MEMTDFVLKQEQLMKCLAEMGCRGWVERSQDEMESFCSVIRYLEKKRTTGTNVLLFQAPSCSQSHQTSL